MSKAKSHAIVAGAGPGLGSALMRRFEQGGYHCTGLVRNLRQSDENLLQADLSDYESSHAVIHQAIERYGAPKLVVHNTAQLKIGPLEDTSVDEFEAIWRSMTLSAFCLAKAVLEPMAASGGGAFLVSGATASLRGGAAFSAFASAKFALRGFTQSIARQYQSAGIHVAHIILDGIVDSDRSRALHSLNPDNMMKIEDIAEIYWQLAHQPESTWSHEIDLRPSSELF